jgi:hypothetical protein
MIHVAPEMMPKGQRFSTVKAVKNKVTKVKNQHKPNILLDRVRTLLGVDSDAKVGYILNTQIPELSRYRQGKRGLGLAMMIAIYDATELSIEEIRQLDKETRNAL